MKKLRVLLINVPTFNLDRFDIEHNKIRGYGLYPPVALTTIAASALKQVGNLQMELLNLEFEIMKYFAENDETRLSARQVMKEILLSNLRAFNPDLTGISVTFSISNSNALAIANLIKRENSKIYVVCGGNHATFAFRQMLKYSRDIDFIFLYESDFTFPLFLEYLNNKISFEDLRGIAYVDKTTNEIKLTPYGPVINNLDSLPIPSWDLVPLKEYQLYGRIGSVNSFGDENKSTYIMQTVRGCIAACRFCSVRNFYGKGVRAFSPERVLSEIDYLYNELGITQLEILDDDFTFDQKRTIQICDGLIKRNYNLVWNILNGIRIGTITAESMESLVRAKCCLISIGIESANEKTLRAVNKPLTIKMLYEKTNILKKYPEMYVKANFIVGFPFENEEETINTFNLAEDLGCDWNIFSVFTPLPGTPLFQQLEENRQEEFDFDSVRNDFQFDEIRNIANQMGSSQDSFVQKQTRVSTAAGKKTFGFNIVDNKELFEFAYIKNLEINFIRNNNLSGRNIDRAIRDFEGIARFIAKDHAVAHYCLAKAYLKKKDINSARENFDKVAAILTNPKTYKWVEYFDKLNLTKELSALRESLEV